MVRGGVGPFASLRKLQFGRAEKDAVLHALVEGERLVDDVDRRGRVPACDAVRQRTRALHDTLAANQRGVVYVRADDELDREIMITVVEHSGWIGLHASESHQKQSAVFAALQRVAEKIEAAFALPRPLRLPVE